MQLVGLLVCSCVFINSAFHDVQVGERRGVIDGLNEQNQRPVLLLVSSLVQQKAYLRVVCSKRHYVQPGRVLTE